MLSGEIFKEERNLGFPGKIRAVACVADKVKLTTPHPKEPITRREKSLQAAGILQIPVLSCGPLVPSQVKVRFHGNLPRVTVWTGSHMLIQDKVA